MLTRARDITEERAQIYSRRRNSIVTKTQTRFRAIVRNKAGAIVDFKNKC